MARGKRRPGLGATVTIRGFMVKHRWTEDDVNAGDLESSLLGQRWEVAERPERIKGIYCGVTRLHQADMHYEAASSPESKPCFWVRPENEWLITCYIVALNHQRRVFVLPDWVDW